MAPAPLPDIPILLGSSNLGRWNYVLRKLLACKGLDEHVQQIFGHKLPGLDLDYDDSVAQIYQKLGKNIHDEFTMRKFILVAGREQDWFKMKNEFDFYVKADHHQWQQNQMKVVRLIKASLKKVWARLIAAGWKPEETSAKYHYDFVMREGPKMEGVVVTDSSTREVIHAPRPKCSSVSEYRSGLSDFHRQLMYFEVDDPEEILTSVAISRLREYAADNMWAIKMAGKVCFNELTWDGLMQTISEEIAEQQS